MNSLHEKALDFSLEYRNKHPDFRFGLRQRNRNERLSNGLWFQGTDSYSFVGLYDRSGGSNMTRSIGLVFYPKGDENEIWIKIEIVFNDEKDLEVIKFYQDVIRIIGDFRKEGETKYVKVLNGDNYSKIAEEFLDNEKPKIDKLLHEYKLHTFIFPEEMFNKHLNNILDLRDKLIRNKVENSSIKELDNVLKINCPLNQILYGPPGTGKTYHTINKALEIIGEDIAGKSRAEIKRIFDTKMDEGQIVFTTFHQSLGYEDFIEGIKPLEPEKDGDPVNYKVEFGIFRNLCVEASFAVAQQRESKKTEEVLDFSILYDQFVETVEEMLLNGKKVELETKAGGKVIVESISQKGNFIIKHIEGTRTYTVSKTRLTKLQAAIYDLDDINNIDNQFRAIIGGSNSSAYWSVLNAIRKVKPLNGSNKVNRSYAIEEKQGVVLSLTQDDYAIKDSKRFVLIIDEINRGNVSQIFGELITLLEEDKRLGNKEGLLATLPYSKERFGMPSNLYIIGTMNTADRSVEALDTALRRRFDFIEMPPKPELLNSKQMIVDLWNLPTYIEVPWNNKSYRLHADALYKILGIKANIEEKYDINWEEFYELHHLDHVHKEDFTGIDFETLLEMINHRLEILIDKDHCIGHSYFLNLFQSENPEEELRKIFQNKIIPLLQEFFFGDLGKMELVIGEIFFENSRQVKNPSHFFARSSHEDKEILADRKVYKVRNVKDPEFDIISAVKEIYQ